MNHGRVSVRRVPRVALLATGDELVAPGTSPGPGQIVYSNGFALAALARSEGAEAIDLGIVPDRVDATVAAIDAATRERADILVTTGGASVGEHDLVRDALGAAGLTLDFWTIAMRPGKPLMVGRFRDTPMIGLPGNPVSTLVCGLLFVKPAIERLSGLAPAAEPPLRARLAVPLDANDRRQDYLRARLGRAADGSLEAEPFRKQDSSMLSLLARSDGLVVRPPHAPAAAAGDWVDVVPLAAAPAAF
jgi:molybdopterin molybdotransferase